MTKAKTLDMKVGDIVKIFWLDAGIHNSKSKKLRGLIETEITGEVFEYLPGENSLLLLHRKNKIDDVTYSVIQVSSIIGYEVYQKSEKKK